MRETTPHRYARWIPAGIVAFGVAVFAADVAIVVYFVGVEFLQQWKDLFGRGVSLTFTALIVGGGYLLHRSDLGVSRYPRIVGWIAFCGGGFLTLNVVVMLVFPAEDLFSHLAWAMFAVYIGGFGGVLIGIVEARAIERAIRAEREAVETEHVETQRQWLDYLNSLLRHEVLNNASIIQGYASLLLEEEDLPPRAGSYVETIHRQSRDMTDVIRDVRILVRAADRIEYREPVDVAAVLEDELGDVRATYPEVETGLSVEGDPYVPADDLLPRIFSNLLANAVEHNPSESPTVSVSVSTTAEAVHVAVADDGHGVPAGERETLFDRGQEDHGLGLYLVRVLADRYDGHVELAETGPDGSVFTVELPRGEPPADETDARATDTEETAAASPTQD